MFDNKRPTLDLCLPVYNEAAILASNVQKIVDFIHKTVLPVDCRLVILVNGSTDQSADITNDLSQRWPELISWRNYVVAGKSRSLMTYATTSSADWWGYMDIDLAVDLADLSKLLQVITDDSADLLVASRLLPGANCSRSLTREIISRGYNFLTRQLLHTIIKDHQCGCKFIRQSWWQVIAPKIKESDWFLDTEMIAWTTKLAGQIKEIPVNWVDNRYQTRSTKVKLSKDIPHFIANLWQLRRRLQID